PGMRVAVVAAAGVFVLILTGAYVRGDGATAACSAWPLCSPDALLPGGGAQLVHMGHRVASAIVGLLVAAAVMAGWRVRAQVPGAGPLAVATGALFAAQIVLGALNPLSAFAPWALGVHPATASALWVASVALAAVLWRPPVALDTLRDYVALTKPGVMSLLLLTALGGTFAAARGIPPLHIVLATLVGGAAASGGAAALNHFFDRDIDERMRRTSARPVVANRVRGSHAVAYGIALNVFAFTLLSLVANVLAASLAIAGTLFYIIVYTLWLKRTTVQNIVIGGAAGAFPPLVGWAAVTGSLDLAAWLLFAIIFAWTPAHFWALALLIKEDYARAGVPMLPVVRGDRETAVGILRYALVLLPLTILLFVIGAAGAPYLIAAIILGALFVLFAVRLVRASDLRLRAVARTTYLYSLLYLALLFVALMVDSTLTVLHLV
ncbi:MAG: protoheme IX farnesyltransferase, partial [Chloroflexi bacterium]|nr:protoheme IX farnesyltransferase [Chloroflexota bacterium]